jgi:hypothetical protein
MKDVTIHLKNCPPQIAAMIVTAFKGVPIKLTGQPMEIPPALEIDFNQLTDPKMQADMIAAAHTIIMGHAWLDYLKRSHEG